jgi:hypothetical protein
MREGWFLSVMLVAMACAPAATSGYNGQAYNAPPPPPNGQYVDSRACDAVCAHLLGCFGQDNVNSRASCNSDCLQRNATSADLDAVQRATCEQIAAYVQGQQGQQGQVDWGAMGGGAAPAPASACTDCAGCVGDGTSCYYGTGQACDACCCAPGGPSPVWR